MDLHYKNICTDSARKKNIIKLGCLEVVFVSQKISSFIKALKLKIN